MSRKHLTVGDLLAANHESEPRGQFNLRDARHGSIECRSGREADLEQRQSGRRPMESRDRTCATCMAAPGPAECVPF